tara:strand:- start:487 stop:1170 length:684 start_codon:yes stop_codon:yes gene_type:complete
MSSKRLPGKALIDIEGKNLLQRTIERTKKIELIDRIILATSILEEDDLISETALDEDIEIFRGDLDFVALRALGACEKFNLDHFVRICGDRPFFDPRIIDRLIQTHLKDNFDITTTMHPRTYPPGLTGEVIKYSVMKNTLRLMYLEEDKEHVTSFFYKNHHNFKIKNVGSLPEEDYEGVELVVDNQEDLNKIRWIASKLDLGDSLDEEMKKIIKLAKLWPDYLKELG